MNKSLLFFFSVGLSFLWFSCESEPTPVQPKKEYFQKDPCMGKVMSYDTTDIMRLSIDELPYNHGDTTIPEGYHLDTNGVPIHTYQGVKNRHPVYISQYGLDVLDVFYTTQDSTLLSTLENIADELRRNALILEDAALLPYLFNFPLHGFKDQVMLAPWYSAMAQGQVLSYFCRMYQINKDETYLQFAHQLFNSFLRLKADGKRPWLSCIDKEGNLWLEEYPRETPCLTLNGMIFGIFGVYDYFQLTENRKSFEILQASISTIKKNITRFRVEDELSYYCVKHQVQNHGYHSVHILQLHALSEMTGDPYFAEIAETFRADHAPDPKRKL